MQSPGAFLRYVTSATSLTLTTINNIDSVYPTFAEIGVRINGADYTTVELSGEGEASATVNLGAGADKQVDLIVGLQSFTNNLLGSWIVDAQFNDSAVLQTATTTPRILVYGDSITVGANAGNPSLEGWTQLVRNAYSGSLVCDAWGRRSLNQDGATAGTRQTLVDKWATLSPDIIWLAMGTNDYGLNKWSAANFGVAYADLLDKIHTALPSATIYAQTPIVRTDETANSFGDTLGDYRTEIATAQSTRSAYCTLVDGTAIVTTGDLDDGVHPTTAGQAIYGAYVITALGI